MRGRSPDAARVLLLALLVTAVVFGGWALSRAWLERHRERYVVTVDDSGRAVTRVVTAAFVRAAALKVGTVSGIVQSTAADTRLGGLLSSDQVVKAPYSVDYLLDLGRFSARDVEWRADTRTLVINAPDISVAAPNVDEAHRTLVRTGGVFVTRGAAEALTQRTAMLAARAAREEAGKPEHVARARANARAALSRLLAAPLAAAGVTPSTVVVRFPGERPGGRPWDVSRSVEEVVGH